jgi:hypothetical protein
MQDIPANLFNFKEGEPGCFVFTIQPNKKMIVKK